MASHVRRQWSVLAASTLAFTVCFAVWMMFAVIGIPIKQKLGLNETQFGLLAATPVLTGSLSRLLLGMWTVWMYWTEIVPARNGALPGASAQRA